MKLEKNNFRAVTGLIRKNQARISGRKKYFQKSFAVIRNSFSFVAMFNTKTKIQMKKVIVFSDLFTGIDWFYNSDKSTFVHEDKVDKSDPAYHINGIEINTYIAEIALVEFKCSVDYLENYGLSIREIGRSFFDF